MTITAGTCRTLLLMILAITSTAQFARSALIVSESFNYPAASSLAGASGGSGFTNAWVATGSPFTASQGLIHPQFFNESGLAFTGATNTTVGIKRIVDTSLFPASLTNNGSTFGADSASGTLWIAYLHQLDHAYSYLAFESIKVGTASTSSNLSVTTRTGGGSYALTPGATNLVLIRIIFHAAGLDQITLWVNPASVDNLTTANAVDNYSVGLTAFNQFQFANITTGGGAGVAAFDEFRVSTDLYDVIPEPASLALLASLVLTILPTRRR